MAAFGQESRKRWYEADVSFLHVFLLKMQIPKPLIQVFEISETVSNTPQKGIAR